MKLKFVYLGARFKWIDPPMTLTEKMNSEPASIDLGGGF